MALIVDEDKAKRTPCTCYYIGDKKLSLPKEFRSSLSEIGIDPEEVICFSEGMIGVMTNDQEVSGYCNGGIVKESERLKERLRCLSKCAREC